MFVELPDKEQQALLEKHSEALAEQLRRIRSQSGISRNELSQLSGVSRHSITEIEEGNSQPTTGTLMRLTYALGTTVSELFEIIEKGFSLETSDVVQDDPAEYNIRQLDDELEKAFFKLRRKSQTNPDLRTTVLDLAKLQTVYHKPKS